ncbi:MAG: xanthine dehydrogenase family protein molybdopterin-binding subunit [Nostoc sp.]|uniref:xanthine dehydrogenase family protein molybdopterin-binding subunit n=1 Tax=Nostoc sp. TaxID=1180 RepID=UPI002FF00F30
MANVLHGVLITAKIAKGRIQQIDTKTAEATPGVVAVMTHLNAPKAIGKSSGMGTDRSLTLLQDDRVLYSNQPIGVVVADTLENATQAAKLVKVTYASETPNVKLAENIAQAIPPSKKLPREQPADSSRGNVTEALDRAAVKIAETYTTPNEVHNPMEPHTTVAVWQDDRLTLYDATQGVFQARHRVAEALGLPIANVHVQSAFLGGGFGCKGSVWSHVVLTAMAARMIDRPVKLVLERRQMFAPVGFRPQTLQHIAIGATQNGDLTAIKHDTTNQISSFDEFIEGAAVPTRILYRCLNVATSHRLVRLDTGTPGQMRGPGEAPGLFALESAVDELAYKLNIDPLELRIRNHVDFDADRNLPWSSKSLLECYRQGAARFRWHDRNPEVGSMHNQGLLVGMGMATATRPAVWLKASAVVRLAPDGSAIVQSGTQDIGTGTYTIATQVAADALKIKTEKVRFQLGDTRFPEAPNSGGSMTAASVGSAVHLACLAAQRQVAQLAIADARSPLFGAKESDVDAADGRVFLKQSGRRESYAAIMKRHNLPFIEASAEATPNTEKFSTHSFGANFAEVHVDPRLGRVRVARWCGVFDIGHVLNLKTAQSQMIGGIVWGIGMALTEEMVTDSRLGRIVTANLADYHVPVNADIPEIDVSFVDGMDSHTNPIGVKGAGEISIAGAAGAIANAIYHATGKRIRDLPITPDKLLI